MPVPPGCAALSAVHGAKQTTSHIPIAENTEVMSAVAKRLATASNEKELPVILSIMKPPLGFEGATRWGRFNALSDLVRLAIRHERIRKPEVRTRTDVSFQLQSAFTLIISLTLLERQVAGRSCFQTVIRRYGSAGAFPTLIERRILNIEPISSPRTAPLLSIMISLTEAPRDVTNAW
jgi:hypothetical protein